MCIKPFEIEQLFRFIFSYLCSAFTKSQSKEKHCICHL